MNIPSLSLLSFKKLLRLKGIDLPCSKDQARACLEKVIGTKAKDIIERLIFRKDLSFVPIPVESGVSSLEVYTFTAPAQVQIRNVPVTPCKRPAEKNTGNETPLNKPMAKRRALGVTSINKPFKSPLMTPKTSAFASPLPKGTPTPQRRQMIASPMTPSHGYMGLYEQRPFIAQKSELKSKVEQLETKKRNLNLYIRSQQTNEDAKIRALIIKWKNVIVEALVRLRDTIGEIQVSNAKFKPMNPFSYASEPYDKDVTTKREYDDREDVDEIKEPFSSNGEDIITTRRLTLAELAQGMGIDMSLVGDYSPDEDTLTATF